MLAETEFLSATREAAEAADLIYVSLGDAGVTRKARKAHGFNYFTARGKPITDDATIDRLNALAIPPAWTDVWICPKPEGHIQAVGYDARGRKQYRYHPRFREQRDGAKFDHLIAFAQALPALRERLDADMGRPGVGRDKIVATVIHLLEATLIRIGNAAYARDNKSYGLTTLRTRHVTVDGAALKFHFTGKSGKVWKLGLHDRRIARTVRACQDLPGQHLFQYLGADGQRQAVTSSDVNAYLKAATGREISAKDFRTWAGTVLAATYLTDPEAAGDKPTKTRLLSVIKQVASQLGNTPTICRKCYIHPAVMDAYLSGELKLIHRAQPDGGLTTDEAAVLAFLKRWMKTRGD